MINDSLVIRDNAVCSPILLTRLGAEFPIQIALKSTLVSSQPIPGASELHHLTMDELHDWIEHLSNVMVGRKRLTLTFLFKTKKTPPGLRDLPFGDTGGPINDSTPIPRRRRDPDPMDTEMQIPTEVEVSNETKEIRNMPAVADLVRKRLQTHPPVEQSAREYLAVGYYKHFLEDINLVSET